MKLTRAKALKIRAMAMEVATDMTDPEASTLPEMFPKLKEDGSLISAGTRINWNGKLKKAAVALWDTAENNPDNAPNLWEDLNYVNGFRVIPEVITTTTAFSKGEKGWWKGDIYESVHDGANVWTPDQYAAGWNKL